MCGNGRNQFKPIKMKKSNKTIRPDKIFGIKGFDKDLVCLKQQFVVGETYELDLQPKLCSRGFHFCSTVQEVYSYYPNNGSNRFCVIEALGEMDWGTDKHCTNKIKIIRELDAKSMMPKKAYDKDTMKWLCDMGYAIGGSMALRIHGYSFDRELTDLDVVCADFNIDDAEKNFGGYKSIHVFSGADSIYAFKSLFGEKYDILVCKKEDFRTVKRMWEGVELTVMDEDEIWAAKLKYALNGSLKHAKDIINNNITFRPVRPFTSNLTIETLPF